MVQIEKSSVLSSGLRTVLWLCETCHNIAFQVSKFVEIRFHKRRFDGSICDILS